MVQGSPAAWVCVRGDGQGKQESGHSGGSVVSQERESSPEKGDDASGTGGWGIPSSAPSRTPKPELALFSFQKPEATPTPRQKQCLG